MPVLLGESFIEQLGGQSSVKGKFSGIVSLNVSDNPIESVAAMVDEIVLLMPGVRDLQMSLYREADVDLIIQRLPRLQMLSLCNVNLNDESVYQFCQMLMNLRTVRRLNISNN